MNRCLNNILLCHWVIEIVIIPIADVKWCSSNCFKVGEPYANLASIVFSNGSWRGWEVAEDDLIVFLWNDFTFSQVDFDCIVRSFYTGNCLFVRGKVILYSYIFWGDGSEQALVEVEGHIYDDTFD